MHKTLQNQLYPEIITSNPQWWSKFDENQTLLLKRQLDKRDPNFFVYANPKFNEYQMHEIVEGLNQHLKVSLYATTNYNWRQMNEIKEGLKAKVDVSLLLNPRLNHHQMHAIRKGLIKGLDMQALAKPEIKWYDIDAYVENNK